MKQVQRVLAVWSPAGLNTSPLSYRLGEELSKHTPVLVAELPCLGIPRLAFCAGLMDRDKHMDAAILELDKKGEMSCSQVWQKSATLGVLAANVYSFPDYPITHKVELDTLLEVPFSLINAARHKGYAVIVLDCQGQLTTPMTHNALKSADIVLVPVEEPADMAFGLLNIKRLVQVFKYEPSHFRIIAAQNADAVSEIMVLKDEEGRIISSLEVWASDCRRIAANLCEAGEESAKGQKASGRRQPSFLSRIFKRKANSAGAEEGRLVEAAHSEGKEEGLKIRL